MKISIFVVLAALLASPASGVEYGVASVDAGKPTRFDGSFYHGRVSTGEKFDPYMMAMAHRTLPLGTIVRATNKLTGESAYLRVWDRGPCLSKFCRRKRPDLLARIADLTPEAADAIHLAGLGPVVLRVCKRHSGIMICQ